VKGDNRILLVKSQPVLDTDPVPVGSNVVVCEDLDWKPYEGNTISRNRDRPFLGAQEEIRTGAHTAFSFTTELAEASAAGTVPGFGPLLRACGMAEVIVAVTSVTYSPISTGFEFVTAYDIDDQEQLQKSLNCMGSFGIEFNAEQLPKLKFSNFMGTYNRPEALGAAVTVDTSAYEDAVPVSKTATQTATIDGYAMCMDSFNYEQGVNVTYKDRPNCAGTNIENRDGGGTLVIKAPTLADKDVFAFIESHVNVSKVPLVLVHGDGTRPNLTVNIPLVQFTGITKNTINGDLFYSMTYKAIPSVTGNDEIELIF